MKLKSINESTNDLKKWFEANLPDHSAKNKLVNWAFSKNDYTNSSDKHTSGIVRKELLSGLRLVGNPWKEDVDQNELEGLYIADYNKQLMVSLQQNKDVVDYVINSSGAIEHAIRGLSFGYDPKKVHEYSNMQLKRKGWVEYLHENGVKLSSDYGNRGYASSTSGNTGDVVVEPTDLDTVKPILDKLELIRVLRWCPECKKYYHISGDNYTEYQDHPLYDDIKAFDLSECPHKPISTPEKQGISRHWFVFTFKL